LISTGLGLDADLSFQLCDFHMGFGNNLFSQNPLISLIFDHICCANPSLKAHTHSAIQSDPVIRSLQHIPFCDTNRPQWLPNCAAAHSTSLSARPSTSSRPWSTKASSPGDSSHDPSFLPTCVHRSSHTRPCYTPNCSQKKLPTEPSISSLSRALSPCRHRPTKSTRRRLVRLQNHIWMATLKLIVRCSCSSAQMIRMPCWWRRRSCNRIAMLWT
jgi:hypothetical protein